MHFYGNIFGDTQKPILVKHSNKKFPEDGSVDLVKKIVMGELSDEKVKIKTVIAENGTPVKQSKPPLRTIIRFKK